MTTEIDFTIWRGTNAPALIWEFGVTLAEGDVVELLVRDRFGQQKLTRETGVDSDIVLDLDLNRVTWSPSIDVRNSIDLGRLTTYLLELHVGGSESVEATGWLIGRNGPGGTDPIVGRVEPGPRGEEGPPGEVTRAQAISLSLIFG
jgi:hypothetical protein